MSNAETEAEERARAAAAERRQAKIDSLLHERHGYEVTGKADRVKQVDAALKDAGYKAPVGRSQGKSETA